MTIFLECAAIGPTSGNTARGRRGIRTKKRPRRGRTKINATGSTATRAHGTAR